MKYIIFTLIVLVALGIGIFVDYMLRKRNATASSPHVIHTHREYTVQNADKSEESISSGESTREYDAHIPLQTESLETAQPYQYVEDISGHMVPDIEHPGGCSLFEEVDNSTVISGKTLQEIKDPSILSRIKKAVPNTGNVLSRSKAMNSAINVLERKQVYHVVLNGSYLNKSGGLGTIGAVGLTGTSSGAQGVANAATTATSTLSVAANASFAIAAMVVGQHYMTVINRQLQRLTQGLEQVAEQSDIEYRSRISNLLLQVQKLSQFQPEIIESENQRQRVLNELQMLEHECGQLLSRACLMIESITQKNNKDYNTYERETMGVDAWRHYQTILLDLQLRIDDLNHSLNFGLVSREQCYHNYDGYTDLVKRTSKLLQAWHDDMSEKYDIDTSIGQRKRTGLNAVIHKLPSVFSPAQAYCQMNENTVKLIEEQSGDLYIPHPDLETQDLFSKDVELIVKDGKLYYVVLEGHDVKSVVFSASGKNGQTGGGKTATFEWEPESIHTAKSQPHENQPRTESRKDAFIDLD